MKKAKVLAVWGFDPILKEMDERKAKHFFIQEVRKKGYEGLVVFEMQRYAIFIDSIDNFLDYWRSVNE